MNITEDKEANSATETERSLLEAAIELYGQYGTQAVSLNQIRKHAEVANEAAIRYYFRNKQGLIARSLELVAARLKPGLNQLAERLENLESAPDARMVLMHLGLPFASLYEVDRNCVSFMGSLIHEEGAIGQKLLAETFGSVILRYERLLAQALPDKPPELIHVHFFLTMNLLVHGLSDIGILNFMPSIAERPADYFSNPDVLVKAFVDFVHAGICVNEAPQAGDSDIGELLAGMFSTPKE